MKNLPFKQLDRSFNQLNAVKASFNVPSVGWVKTIRKALGMTVAQLARRLGFNRSRIIKIEHSELHGALTLATLKKVASALDCDLVYLFFPKKTLEATLEMQAEKIANDLITRISHSMSLESQNLTEIQKVEQKKELIHKLLSGSLKYLWEGK